MTIKNTLQLLVLGVIPFCICAGPCFATTEPELTTAVRHKEFQHVQTLLSEGVNINERDEGSEQTPLMWAVQTNQIAVVRVLIQRHAQVNLRDDAGNTALSLAREKGFSPIAKLLIENGAKPNGIRTASARTRP